MASFPYLEKFLNRLKDIHSIVDFDSDVEKFTPVNILTNEKFETKYTPVYLNSVFSKDIQHIDGIFQHTSGFYIYLCRDSVEEKFRLKIIYKTEQYEEVKLYINTLKKIIKNGD